VATKKQKREEALAKRAAFEEQVKADGLKALEADKKRQAERREAMTTAAKQVNEHYQGILDNATPEERAAARSATVKRNTRVTDRKPTSFYSEKQGRPVNAATIAAERKAANERIIAAETLDAWFEESDKEVMDDSF
jgi:hypothetical protein